ncbi:hypothetical protein EV201_3045 [Ancylomarina subtilis]|uniref:Uncharacterized protein n=1 Tax=Ancylomarina subtilis TaxID=1639035 RepID=A0A4Q7V880_9BACT|nr:hypothetical protein [Ancylomarina subtilis]RZT91827.1 hypothetical protein EV201_3045 [Ancylomarina subtilis]
MENLKNGLPIIISDNIHFSCFGGVAKGNIIIDVHDKGTTEFPTTVKADTNLGSGTVSIVLKGNEKITKKVSGVEIQVEVSKWNCTPTELSFHLKAKAKKSFLSCTIVDKTLRGARYDNQKFEAKLTQVVKEAESVNA